MGTGWEQRLAQIDAELAELGEPTEGADTLRARVAALSRGELSELDRELEHMERLTRAASRRSLAERTPEEAGSGATADTEGGVAEASRASEREIAGDETSGPSWAQALFDEAESTEEIDEFDLEVGSETNRAAAGGGGTASARNGSTDDSEGLAGFLEGDEDTSPSHEPATESAPEARADAESGDDEDDYDEIDTGEVEVLVEEDDVMVEEGEAHQVSDDADSRDPSRQASN